jgi:hypothetical protein
LPGKRFDPMRAGMTATALMGQINIGLRPLMHPQKQRSHPVGWLLFEFAVA